MTNAARGGVHFGAGRVTGTGAPRQWAWAGNPVWRQERPNIHTDTRANRPSLCRGVGRFHTETRVQAGVTVREMSELPGKCQSCLAEGGRQRGFAPVTQLVVMDGGSFMRWSGGAGLKWGFESC